MKYLFMLLMACAFVVDVYGQTSIQVKLYQNSDFFESTYSRGNSSRQVQNHHFDRVTVAVNLTCKNNWMHELELFIPETSTSPSQARFPVAYTFREESADFSSHVNTYAFRYEMSKVFHADRRLYYSLGLGLNPYYTKAVYDPLVTYAYYNDYKIYGVALNVIPRIAFKVTWKLRVDMNVPLKVYDLRRERRFVANPALPVSQQKSGVTVHKFFENIYTVRVGIAYVLK